MAQGFIIMQIGNADLDKVCKDAIVPALAATGLQPCRVDKHNQGGLLKSEIIQFIQSADIIVADLTNERPNCYLEVGFAMGIDKFKNLILTVRGDHQPDRPGRSPGEPKVHFDLAGYDLLYWQPDDLPGFRAELEKRIRRRLAVLAPAGEKTNSWQVKLPSMLIETFSASAMALLVLAAPAAAAGPDCGSADDCRLILSNCGCEAVAKGDPRTELASDAVCKWNLCQGTKVEAVCRSGRCCRSDAGGENAPPCPAPAQAPAEPRFFPIHEIKGGSLPPGEYRTEGYVAKVYVCPPCPPPAMCKPCMRDNIVISERKSKLTAYSLSEREMILFTRGSGGFKLGQRYAFTLRITEGRSTSEPINDAEVLDYRKR